MKRFIFFILDHIGHRESQKTYLGHGDFEEERGWYIFGRWISAERFIQ